MLEEADIRVYWPRIKSLVKDLTDQMGDQYESVYASCLYRDSTLLVCEDGFMIVQVKPLPFTAKKELFIWIASTWEKSGHSIAHKYFDQLESVAKGAGCSSISFETKKRGFDKLLPEGWTQLKVVYQKEI